GNLTNYIDETKGYLLSDTYSKAENRLDIYIHTNPTIGFMKEDSEIIKNDQILIRGAREVMHTKQKGINIEPKTRNKYKNKENIKRRSMKKKIKGQKLKNYSKRRNGRKLSTKKGTRKMRSKEIKSASPKRKIGSAMIKGARKRKRKRKRTRTRQRKPNNTERKRDK
ncbi:unnamed protein product, partial [Meganyctiphanes norvegica]